MLKTLIPLWSLKKNQNEQETQLQGTPKILK